MKYIREQREQKKFSAILVIITFIILALLVDYGNQKVIPNFFYLNTFTKADAGEYWSAVIKIVVVVVSLLTFWQTSDKFFFEKRMHNDNQRGEVIRKYQELVRSAIEIFNEKYEDEGECLFAVQILQNIVSLYDNGNYAITSEEQVEPFRVISIEGIICLLKKHLDRVWSIQRENDEVRQDVAQVVRLLYVNNRGLWDWEVLKQCGACRFKDVYINLEYFDYYLLKGMEFFNVVFYDNNDYVRMCFEGSNTFEGCTFKCDYNFFVDEYGSVILKKCELQGLRIIEFTNVVQNKGQLQGTKGIRFIETTFKGFVNMDRNLFDSIVIESCGFENVVYMREMKVKSEMTVCDTVFLDDLDFQQSIFEWRIQFKNVQIEGLLYFWAAEFYNKNRVSFWETYFGEFENGNWLAEVYEDEKNSNRKYCFKELFEVITDEESHRMKLAEKRLKRI